ncbi:MAG: hypothetical protein Q8O14_09670 [bacterium]|nr:hypothetical protein [bacterium]
MTLKRGYMTRLIDVTLIILIGFLAVADLDDRAALQLPRGISEALDTLDLGQRRLTITAAGPARFLLELQSATGLNRPLGAVSGADTLRAVLLRLKSEHGLGAADVEVLAHAPVQTAVDAVDACDLCELPREIRFQRRWTEAADGQGEAP